MKATTLCVVNLALASCLVGCASDKDGRDVRVGNSSNVSGASTSQFLSDFARKNQRIAALGEMASRESGAGDVRDLGTRIARHHQDLNRDIRQVASEEGVLISAAMPGETDYGLNQLRGVRGEQFDKQFLADVIMEHEELISRLEAQSRTATDPDVKRLANRAIPMLEEHLREARRLAQRIGVNPVKLQQQQKQGSSSSKDVYQRTGS